MPDLKNIRIIVSDIDGTLLPFEGKDMTATVRLIGELIRRDYTFVLCTGRGTGNIPRILMEIPGLRYVITANGALVTDLARSEVIYRNTVPRDLARRLTRFLRGYRGIVFSYRCGRHFLDMPAGSPLPEVDSPSLRDWMHTAKTIPFEDYLAEPESEFVDKVGFATFDLEAREAVMRDFPAQPFASELAPTTSGTWNVEFNAAGTSKGNAAHFLLDRLGLTPANMLAAGDNINDIPMLQLAAVSLAPANAAPETLAAASVRVADAGKDGVENFLKQLL